MAPDGEADTATVVGAADELYGVPAGDFVRVRKRLADEAKAAGDPAASQAISRLGKPNAAAWLANQLVRAHRGQVRELLDLGASMRDATRTLDAGQLREFSRGQHSVVGALVDRARGLADTPVSESTARGLAETLHAAMADPEAGARLLSGRLTSGLSSSGFPGVELDPAASERRPSTRAAAKALPRTRSARDRDRLDRAEREAVVAVRVAVQAAERATAARDLAATAAGVAETALDAVSETVGRLRAELDAAIADQRSAERTYRTAREALDLAERAVARSRARADQLTTVRDDAGAED